VTGSLEEREQTDWDNHAWPKGRAKGALWGALQSNVASHC